MTTSFTWSISNLEYCTEDGVVFSVYYNINASRESSVLDLSGSVDLEAPDPSTMIPYDDLSEEIVVGWVKDTFSSDQIDQIESGLQSQLDYELTKETGMPW